MLLTHSTLKSKSLGSAASTFRGTAPRESVVVLRSARTTMKKAQELRASSKEGWLETASSKLEAVGGYLEKKLQGDKPPLGPDEVLYKGTAIVMKKLKVLDLIDRVADLQDDASELVRGKRVSVQLVSAEVDPKTGKAMMSKEVPIQNWVSTLETLAAQDLKFNLDFAVPKSFGVPGAIIVNNHHPNEFLLVSFNLSLPGNNVADYITNSWVYPTTKTGGRIFFHNKPYLPADTPEAIKDLRAKELENVRGDGKGQRVPSDRIYDYAPYNDLGDPDKDMKLFRPTLGGNAEYHYPRRCRTGRPPSKTKPEAESQSKEDFYIPRDECFDRVKMADFKADGARSVGHSIQAKASIKLTGKSEFNNIGEIKKLFVKKGENTGGLNNMLTDVDDVDEEEQFPLVFLQEFLNPDGKANTPTQYPIPRLLQHDEDAWMKNSEFAREFLAGVNPVAISLVQEFPIKSTLKDYGYAESAIKAEHIEAKLEGMSVDEAVEAKKIFVVDFHDSYLPYCDRINAQDNARCYATRSLFFLKKDQTLETLALELALPKPGNKIAARVFTPPADESKIDYLWEMAKAHVANNDITAHQVFSHFTRCHAVTEANIIASNRALSKLHPIMQLMAPHFKCTMEINRAARKLLICAGGQIETHFTPRAYSLELGAVNYKDTWTWESQALPNDLVARGMAVRDPDSKHGVKLVIEDYPYAADGLELWTAIKNWNKEYVDIWYKDDGAISKDEELQNWWHEVRYKAHEDKANAPGWPTLDNKESLVEILTTMQWIPSCQHAAVNFGQFDYAGWMPHHPTIVRRLIPEEGTKEWDEMKKNPEKAYMLCLANIDSTTTAMSVYEVLSAHSPKEEYIGERPACWTSSEQSIAAFKRFTEKIGEVDQLIKSRNADKTLKNRYGAVNMPYQLLRPKSKPGVTSMGVPNSITI